MYTIKQASLRSGVSVPLLRAWERRYAVVEPVRTASGYRLYDDGAISRLRAMRALIEGGRSARQAAVEIAAADAHALERLAGGQGQAGDGMPVAAAASRLIPRLVSAAAALDQAAFERALDECFAAMSFEVAMGDVVFPALVEIGEAWACDDLDVSAEHAAGAAVQRRLGAAFAAAGRAPGAPVVLVGLPAQAQHELAVLAFGTALRRAGLDAIYLGPNVPVGAWLHAADSSRAAAAVIGTTMERDASAARQTLTALHEAYPALLLAVGGRHAEAARIDGTLRLPDELPAAVAEVRTALLGGPASAQPTS
jgi:DNA-binding transcriptional MerR regulator/methylmalonyl-CoA mutase cobalamin-binding subunit